MALPCAHCSGNGRESCRRAASLACEWNPETTPWPGGSCPQFSLEQGERVWAGPVASASLLDNPPFAWSDMCFTPYICCSTFSSLLSQLKVHSRKMTGKHSPVLSTKQLPSIEGSAWITSTPCGNRGNSYILVPSKALLLTDTQHRTVTLLPLTRTCMSNTSNITVVLGWETCFLSFLLLFF